MILKTPSPGIIVQLLRFESNRIRAYIRLLTSCLHVFGIEEVFFEVVLSFFSFLLMFNKEFLHTFGEDLFAFAAHDISGKTIDSEVFDFLVLHEEEVVIGEH